MRASSWEGGTMTPQTEALHSLLLLEDTLDTELERREEELEWERRKLIYLQALGCEERTLNDLHLSIQRSEGTVQTMRRLLQDTFQRRLECCEKVELSLPSIQEWMHRSDNSADPLHHNYCSLLYQTCLEVTASHRTNAPWKRKSRKIPLSKHKNRGQHPYKSWQKNCKILNRNPANNESSSVQSVQSSALQQKPVSDICAGFRTGVGSKSSSANIVNSSEKLALAPRQDEIKHEFCCMESCLCICAKHIKIHAHTQDSYIERDSHNLQKLSPACQCLFQIDQNVRCPGMSRAIANCDPAETVIASSELVNSSATSLVNQGAIDSALPSNTVSAVLWAEDTEQRAELDTDSLHTMPDSTVSCVCSDVLHDGLELMKLGLNLRE